jgi:hypothetical protein
MLFAVLVLGWTAAVIAVSFVAGTRILKDGGPW